MTREWDGDGDYPYQLWEHSLKRALHGPRARRTFQRLIDALDALPVHVLSEGELAEPHPLMEWWEDADELEGHFCPMAATPWAPPMVCAIGAMALMSGWSIEELLDFYEGGIQDTVDVGTQLGIARTVAGLIAEENDGSRRTQQQPAERWKRMRAWAEIKRDEATP